MMTDAEWESEREALGRWLTESSGAGIVATSAALRAISHRVAVWAAVSALRALLDDVDGDPWIDPYHIERAASLADAIEAWLREPSDARLSAVREQTGGVERIWNDLSGDTGQPEPVLAAATNTGWCARQPDQSFNLTPALGEAERRMGEERVVASVRSALAGAPPWSRGSRG